MGILPMIPPSRIAGVGEGRTRGLVLVEGGVTFIQSFLLHDFYIINVFSWARRSEEVKRDGMES